MNEASKTLLVNAVKEWTKFVTERERMRGIATEVAAVTQRVVMENMNFMKTQNVDVQSDDPASLKIMGHPVVVEPVIDAVFPNVKAKVNLTCSGATRSIVINPNGSISAGGNPFMFDQLKKGVPDSFMTNAAEFVSDAFLFVVRNMTPEEQAAAQVHAEAPAPAPPHVEPPPPPVQPAPAAQPAHATAPQPAPASPRPAQPAPQQPRPAAPPQRPGQPAPQQRPGQPIPPKPGQPMPPRPGQPMPPKPGQPKPPKPPGPKTS